MRRAYSDLRRNVFYRREEHDDLPPVPLRRQRQRIGELLLDIYDLYRWNVSLTAISLFSGEATPSLIF